MIVFPKILFIFILTYILIQRKKFIEWIRLKPEKGLALQPLLWISMLSPLILFFYFGYFVWKDYTISLSYDGFDNFIKISKLPLGILAISLPLSALIIRIHSTHQAAIQIASTYNKYKQDTYYAHKKAFSDSFSSIPNKVLFGFTEKSEYYVDNRLYKKVFPESHIDTGVTICSETYLHNLYEELEILGMKVFTLVHLSTECSDEDNFATVANLVFSQMNKLCNLIYIDIPCEIKERKHFKLRYNTQEIAIKILAKNLNQIVGQTRYLYTYIENISSFSDFSYEIKDPRLKYIVEDSIYWSINEFIIRQKKVVIDRMNNIFEEVENGNKNCYIKKNINISPATNNLFDTFNYPYPRKAYTYTYKNDMNKSYLVIIEPSEC